MRSGGSAAFWRLVGLVLTHCACFIFGAQIRSVILHRSAVPSVRDARTPLARCGRITHGP